MEVIDVQTIITEYFHEFTFYDTKNYNKAFEWSNAYIICRLELFNIESHSTFKQIDDINEVLKTILPDKEYKDLEITFLLKSEILAFLKHGILMMTKIIK